MGPSATTIEDLLVACLDSEQPAVTLEELCQRHGDLAPSLRDLFERVVGRGIFLDVHADANGDSSSNASAGPTRIGRFEILERLGLGGMGIVYRAREDKPGREVALKVIRPELTFYEGGRLRFQREIEAVAKLSHPAILPIHAVGIDDGTPWFSMPVVRGCSLGDVLDACRNIEAPTGQDFVNVVRTRANTTEAIEVGSAASVLARVSWIDAVLHVLRDIASALAHAHRHGVLHRDVKPSNILVTAGGQGYLVDFGLALASDDVRLTRSGAELGSLPYAPPEQVRGEREKIDARADEYGFGITLYEALTFCCPYLAESAEETRRRVLEAKAPAPRTLVPKIERDLEVLCQKAMAPEVEERYPSMADLLADIDRYQARQPITARPPSLALRLRRWQQRHPLVMVAAALLAFTSAAFGLVLWRQERTARIESERLNAEVNESLYIAQLALAARHTIGQGHAQARSVLAACEARYRDWAWRQLSLTCDASLRHVASIDATPHVMAVGSDERVVVCGSDAGLDVIDLDSGALRWRFATEGHVDGVAVDTKNARVAATGADGWLRVFDLSTGLVSWSAQHRCNAPRFLADGRVAAVLENGLLQAWDAANGAVLASCKIADGGMAVLEPLASPALLAAVCGQRLVVLDLAAGDIGAAEARRFDVTTAFPSPACLRFVPDGSAVLVESMDLMRGKVMLEAFDARSGVRRFARPIQNGAKFAITRDGKTLAIELLALQKLEDGTLLRTLSGTEGVLRGIEFLAEDKRLLTLDGRGDLRLFSTERSPEQTRFDPMAAAICAVAAINDAEHAIVADTSGQIAVLDMSSGKTVARRRVHTQRIQHVAPVTSAGSSAVLSVARDGTAQLSSIDELETLRGFTVLDGDARDGDAEVVAATSHGATLCCAIANGAKTSVRFLAVDARAARAAPGANSAASATEVSSEVGRIEVDDQVRGIAIDPASRRLVLGCTQGRLIFFDFEGSLGKHTGTRGEPRLVVRPLRQVQLEDTKGKRESGDVKTLRFSPDGTLLLACATSPVIHAVDTTTFATRRRWSEAQRTITAFDFDEAGRRFFAAGYDGTLFYFDVERAASIYAKRISRVMTLALAYCKGSDSVVVGGIDRVPLVLHGKAPPPWSR